MKIISLTKGLNTIVDDDIYDSLSKHKWCIDSRGYAVSKIKGVLTSMHRFIMQTPIGMHTDHIDRNPLNNLKENLRICTAQQNKWNQRPRKNTSSHYKGVTARGNKWESSIKVNGKSIYLGSCSNEEDASILYDIAAQLYFGPYAYLNSN